MKTIDKIGFWSARISAFLNATYVVLLSFLSVFLRDLTSPNGLATTVLSLYYLIAPFFWITLFSSLFVKLKKKVKIFGLVALIFIALQGFCDSIFSWINITVIQIAQGYKIAGMEHFLPSGQYSFTLAIERLGWGWFQGLANIALSLVFYKTKFKLLFWSLFLNGLFLIIGVIGTITNTPLKHIGMISWSGGIFLNFILLSNFFKKN